MFELFQSENNQKFYFNLKAKNGQIILSSQGYADKNGAENGINSIKNNCSEDGKYERKTATNGKFHFNIKAGNGQIIGSSQMYASEAGMENGIDSVKTNAPDAAVKDNS